MSAYEGKKIVSAMEAFNKNKIIQTDVTSLLGVALRSGGITNRHIDKLHQALLGEVETLPANFGVTRPRRTRSGTAFLFYGHMMVNRDVDGSFSYDQYTPNIVSYSIEPKKFLRNHVLMPISFNSQHTAFRFIQRTAKVLDYESDEFFTSILFANTMMQALRGHVPPSTKPFPMFIPHKNGLFLGYAEPMPEGTYRRELDYGYRHGKHFNTVHLTAPTKAQPYVPEMRVVVKTFVASDDMAPEKRRVWKKLYGLIENEDHKEAFETSLSTHIVEHTNLSEKAKGLESLFADMREIIGSRDWNHLARAAYRNGHIPDRGFVERVASAGAQTFSVPTL